MAEMENFNFDTSDTNFAEVSYDGSKVANQALAETDKIYAASYERAKANAIADAEMRSRNYQKFGKLIGQAAEFKKKLDQWNDTKQLEKDQTDGRYVGADGRVYDKDGNVIEGAKPEDIKPPKTEKENKEAEQKVVAEKQLNKESNALKVEAASETTVAVENANEHPENNDAVEEAVDTVKVSNIPTYDENSAASAKKAVNWSSTFVAKNLNTPLSNAMVPGANGRTYNQLFDEDPALAQEALNFWARSALMQSGALDHLKGRHKTKMLADLRKNIDGITNKSLNRKLEEELKLSEVLDVLNLADILVNNPQDASAYFFGTEDDPNSGLLNKFARTAPGGKKDMNYAFAKLGDRLEKAFNEGYIGTAELQMIRDLYFPQAGTKGKQTNLLDLNTTGSKLLDKKLGDLIMRSQKKENDNYEQDKKNKANSGILTIIGGYKEQNKNGQVVTQQQKDKDLAKLAKDLQIPVTSPLLDDLRNYYIPGDYDDDEEARWLILDVQRDGKIDGGDLEGRLAAIKNEKIREATRKRVESILKGFEPTEDFRKKANKRFNALANITADGTVLDPDKATDVVLTIISNMEQDYEILYAEGFAVGGTAQKAHDYAIDKIKAKHDDKNNYVEVIDEKTGEKKMVSPYRAPNMGIKDKDIKSAMLYDRTIDLLNKDMDGTLDSQGFLLGEMDAMPMAIRALKNETGVIPEYYINLSRKTGIHPLKLIKRRMEALGIDPKDADPNDLYFTRFDTFDESLSDRDKKRLNTFPTTSNAIQIVTQNKHGVSLYDTDSITNNPFYDSMSRKNATYDSFVDTTGRSYDLSETTPIQEMSMSDIGGLFSTSKNKSRSGIQYGPKIKVGRYDWNKDTFEAALKRSGLPPDAPFNAKNQNLLLDAHSKNVLYSDNQLTSIGAFTGDSDSQLSIEPVQVDFDESAIWNEEFSTEPFLSPNSLPMGLFDIYILNPQ